MRAAGWNSFEASQGSNWVFTFAWENILQNTRKVTDVQVLCSPGLAGQRIKSNIDLVAPGHNDVKNFHGQKIFWFENKFSMLKSHDEESENN